MRRGSDQSYRRRSQTPFEPSVTSAWVGPWLCTLRYPSALLGNSFLRPGPKSVSPARNCSGVAVVLWWRWIVAMACSMIGVTSLPPSIPVRKVAHCYKNQWAREVHMSSDTSAGMPEVGTVDMKLEVVTLPVTDVDRAKAFYQ